jgi:hypothetical protein
MSEYNVANNPSFVNFTFNFVWDIKAKLLNKGYNTEKPHAYELFRGPMGSGHFQVVQYSMQG